MLQLLADGDDRNGIFLDAFTVSKFLFPVTICMCVDFNISCPVSHHFHPLRSKYSLQRLVLYYASMFLPFCVRPSFTPIQKIGKVIVL